MNATPLILLLGSNQGESLRILKNACTKLETQLGEIKMRSSVYRTKAWGETDQPDFLNQVISIEYTGDVTDALQTALNIEKIMGRVRIKKWGARHLDIDLLYHGDTIQTSTQLTLPHPALHLRRFTLVPLVEILPDFIHPVLNKSQQQLLDECSDQLAVIKLSEA